MRHSRPAQRLCTKSPGQLIRKRHDPGTLEPQWEGPFQVILSTPTAVKAWGKKRWIHRTHIKKAGRKQNQ
uniref:Murine leukemia virus integrase C-terminal domain-containing protein n=1 Tax=Myotis myotis TaxID=51298 RepID=A0A7J7RCJ6_MYOMY|nr:hypothetical protein mMyoMyo1_010838 [Myotis myotis]